MAENETLDLGRSYRWRRVLKAVQRGDTVEAVGEIALESIRQTLKKIKRQIDFGEALNIAFTSPERLPEFVRRAGGHDFAQLLMDVVEQGASPKQIAARL